LSGARPRGLGIMTLEVAVDSRSQGRTALTSSSSGLNRVDRKGAQLRRRAQGSLAVSSSPGNRPALRFASPLCLLTSRSPERGNLVTSSRHRGASPTTGPGGPAPTPDVSGIDHHRVRGRGNPAKIGSFPHRRKALRTTRPRASFRELPSSEPAVARSPPPRRATAGSREGNGAFVGEARASDRLSVRFYSYRLRRLRPPAPQTGRRRRQRDHRPRRGVRVRWR